MKKLAVANPSLTYPERKALLADFVPEGLVTDTEVAGYIEKNGESIEQFVQAVKDEWCADSILTWACVAPPPSLSPWPLQFQSLLWLTLRKQVDQPTRRLLWLQTHPRHTFSGRESWSPLATL